MRKVIRLNDPTTHGGKVITAAPNSKVLGVAVARKGDRCLCPIRGHDNCVIAEGDPQVLIDGVPVAFEGHATSCGAKLISTVGRVAVVKRRKLSIMWIALRRGVRGIRRFVSACTVITLGIAMGIAASPVQAEPAPAAKPNPEPARPYMAQVVGLQWLNPLERMDYPTEWQLLWTLGLVKPNPDDDMVKTEPQTFTKLQAIAAIAHSNFNKATLEIYHEQYLRKLTTLYRDVYFSDSDYFYNAHNVKDRSTWRELAGIHVEYALPAGRLDPVKAANMTRDLIIKAFDIGLPAFPNSWTRSTPPDVRLTLGGANAGFTSLSAALDYLQAHPKETVWVMNWDAPSYPPKDEQINENMVLLILAGPDFKTERAPLAWLGYPASAKVADFDSGKSKRPRAVQAWKSAVEKAVRNADKQTTDIGYVIHDASNNKPTMSDRIAALARTVTEEMPELDFTKQTFNTPELLGEMGAGTALTNVALGIAYANHIGKNVLVAGTTDEAQPVATVVVPPAVVRPLRPEPWYRSRGPAYLPWWGIRHDMKDTTQGYSR